MLRTIAFLTFSLVLAVWGDAPQAFPAQPEAAGPSPRFDIDVLVILSDAEAANIDRSLRINKLKLTGPRVTNAALAHLPELAAINLLSIESTQITNAGLELIQKANVRSLRLWQRSFDDAALRQLGKLAQLEFLDLEGTQAGGAELGQLKGLEKLQTLALGSSTQDAQLEVLTSLAALQELDLRGCQTLSDEAVKPLQTLSNLQTLWLPRQITEQGQLRIQQKLLKCRILR